MYYICVMCGSRYYSAASYETLNNHQCEACGGPIIPEEWVEEVM